MSSTSNNVNAREDKWVLRLYIAGQTPHSRTAEQTLRRVCDEHLTGNYSLEVVDLQKDPTQAERDRIFAVPTVVRQNPSPKRKIIGDMSNLQQVLTGLGLPR